MVEKTFEMRTAVKKLEEVLGSRGIKIAQEPRGLWKCIFIIISYLTANS